MIKRTLFYLLMVAMLPISACAPWKKALYSKGTIEEAIHNSIMDFTKCKLYKSDKAFSVEFLDGDPYIVTISGMLDNTLLAYPTGRITYSPTECLVIDGKLFFWNNPQVERSSQCVEMLDDYGLIDSSYVRGEIRHPVEHPYTIYERAEGAVYYICPDNLCNYKRVITWKATGTYPQPKLKCNKKK